MGVTEITEAARVLLQVIIGSLMAGRWAGRQAATTRPWRGRHAVGFRVTIGAVIVEADIALCSEIYEAMAC